MRVDALTAPPMRQAILGLLLVNESLLLVGVILYPTVLHAEGLRGLGAATAILGLYGFLALRSRIAPPTVDPWLMRTGMRLGSVSAGILCLDLVSGYLVSHNAGTNARTSLVAYGCFLVIVLGAGGWGTARTGRVWAGVTMALWCVIAALLIWFCVEFASYYLFAHTASGAAFIRMEMEADFARSGASDYAAFVMEDLYGAGFFHLLAGLILALLLGTLGAFGGLVTRRATRRMRRAHPNGPPQ